MRRSRARTSDHQAVTHMQRVGQPIDVMGGLSAGTSVYKYTPAVDPFNGTRMSTNMHAPMPFGARQSFRLISYAYDRIILIGGMSRSTVFNDVWWFTMSSSRWSRINRFTGTFGGDIHYLRLS
jgi:hypothetical protein